MAMMGGDPAIRAWVAGETVSSCPRSHGEPQNPAYHVRGREGAVSPVADFDGLRSFRPWQPATPMR